MKTFFRWLKIGIILYCVIGLALWFLQDHILFHPVSLDPGYRYNFEIAHRELNIEYDRKTTLNIIQFLSGRSEAKGVVLYFHGNKKNVSWYARYAPYFTRHGYEVWMIDYPGFGKSTGKMTEERLYEYARQLYKLARTRFEKNKIIIYGKSMGTGIAAYLASARDCRALVLETPYYSMSSLVRMYLPVFPVERLIHYRLPTYSYLQQVDAPVTMFHGTDDGVIPYRNAVRLTPFLKAGDAFVTIPGGNHNDLYSFPLLVEKLDSILSR